MRQIVVLLVFLSTIAPAAPGAAIASSEIRRACLSADRPAANRALCGCIQNVADTMFSSSERRKIAKFFKDPHMTQELRQSDRRSDERFWEKYKQFGQVARQHCSES